MAIQRTRVMTVAIAPVFLFFAVAVTCAEYVPSAGASGVLPAEVPQEALSEGPVGFALQL